ncbi:hypothetical protein D3C72_1732660 [compost metagenome]
MLAEVGRCHRDAGHLEISRRADYNSGTLRNMARRHARVLQRSHAECNVHALFQQIDIPVVQQNIDLEVRVLIHERFQRRQNMQARECNSRTYAKSPGKTRR